MAWGALPPPMNAAAAANKIGLEERAPHPFAAARTAWGIPPNAAAGPTDGMGGVTPPRTQQHPG